MTDLRTRIAAALERGLEGQLPDDLPDRYYRWIGYDTLADAIIRELGLRQERVELLTRYVTEWHTNA